MEAKNQNQNQNQSNSKKINIQEAASDLLDEGIKYAHNRYEEGLKIADEVTQEAKVYSDELLESVRKHPLKAILIAGGVGLVLSALLRK